MYIYFLQTTYNKVDILPIGIKTLLKPALRLKTKLVYALNRNKEENDITFVT